jgi:four helix bundle protein
MSGKDYSELLAWQKAMDLVEEVYKRSTRFPKHELFGLASQLRRAAVSVPSNIAEGQGRRSKSEFAHHLAIAHGSLCEVETQINIAGRLHYMQQSDVSCLLSMASQVGKLINGLSNSLRYGQ